MPQPIFLVGPTCAGKSTVAIELAIRINAEIVSCDSMQVYRRMDIGTAKPTEEERTIVPHHMIDILDLSEEYNVSQYVKDADKAIADIQKRNKIPLVVGGTGLYVKALIDGLFVGPKADKVIRDRLEGMDSLYEELRRVDPVSSARIKPQDRRRIIRALEVYYITGKPISSFQTQWHKRRGVFLIGLNRDREELYNRIDKRVEKMFQDGFVSEVKRLMGDGLTQNKTASQALGYKEILGYVDGKYTLDETKDLIKKNTRRFARRQLTWFRKDDRVRWFFIQKDEDVNVTVERIIGGKGERANYSTLAAD